MTRAFNPYKEAEHDQSTIKSATRQHWRRFCCKCNKEKPVAGGTFPTPKGARMTVERSGVMRRFICADCLPPNQPPEGSPS